MDFFGLTVEKNNGTFSFNGLAFDAQITTHILKNYVGWSYGGETFAKDMYKFAQRTIDKANMVSF